MYTCLHITKQFGSTISDMKPVSEVHDRNTRSAANCDLYVPLGRQAQRSVQVKFQISCK